MFPPGLIIFIYAFHYTGHLATVKASPREKEKGPFPAVVSAKPGRPHKNGYVHARGQAFDTIGPSLYDTKPLE